MLSKGFPKISIKSCDCTVINELSTIEAFSIISQEFDQIIHKRLPKSSIIVHFSSPEPESCGGAYRMGILRCPSSSTISKDFSSETTWRIVTEFHM